VKATKLDIFELARHFDVSVDIIRDWRKKPDFPSDAWDRRRQDGALVFDLAAVISWLQSRPAPRRARPAKWRTQLGLPQYRREERKAARLKHSV